MVDYALDRTRNVIYPRTHMIGRCPNFLARRNSLPYRIGDKYKPQLYSSYYPSTNYSDNLMKSSYYRSRFTSSVWNHIWSDI